MGKITVNNIGKAYKQYKKRYGRLIEWLMPFFGSFHVKKWVLKNINFTVNEGEAVGIIGINGAGKSTLLKIITGTTTPTTGTVTMHGKVAALLELGMGFHPDFTGRQNVYMAGQMLGYSYEEIHKAMSHIESFAEIGEYIDYPVRVYSSGMQVRLAFSTATAYRPGILIVDEALSVGDAYFQHKSFERIREFRKQGTTLLFVSHDKAAIQSICDRAILLSSGTIVMEGQPEAVMDYYNAILADKQNQQVRQEVKPDGKIQTISGTGEAKVEEIKLLDLDGKQIEVVDVAQKVILSIRVKTYNFIENLVLGFGIKDRLGQVMYGTNTYLTKQSLSNVPANSEIIYNIQFPANFGIGTYSVQTALSSSDTHLVNNYEWQDLALIFNIVNNSNNHFAGCTWLNPSIEINQLEKI